MGMFVVGEVVEIVVVWFIFALRLLNNIVIFCTDTVYLTKETYIMHSIPQNHSEKNALIDHADHITSIFFSIIGIYEMTKIGYKGRKG